MKRAACASLVSFGALLLPTLAFAQYQIQPLWSIAPDVRPYLTGTVLPNTQRGIAYNPTTGNLLLANRAGGNSINILDGTTGADRGALPGISLVTGGTLTLNMIGVAGDGAIYAGNLTGNAATTNFKLYRWASETANPVLVFDGTPAPGKTDNTGNVLRFGDTMDVRGSGSSTQIILGSRGGNTASILTTSDGTAFTATLLQTDAPVTSSGNGPFGLGIAFGGGNTLWGKSSASGTPTTETPLREFSFDLATSSAVTILSAGQPGVSIDIRNVAYDAAHGLLAGVNNVNHTLSLFDVSTGTPVLLDTENFPGANANANGTGAADFGGGKLFALDTNNGLVAYDLIPEPREYLLLALGLGGLWWYRRHSGQRG